LEFFAEHNALTERARLTAYLIALRLAITKDRQTSQDVSTVQKRSSLNSDIGTRTVIAHFARPFKYNGSGGKSRF
jgi:hypothetical protein